MTYDLNDRVAVVLGGTSEIGHAVVDQLTRCGANVVFQGTNSGAADSILRGLRRP
jgi:NAD(P)-dependent dehydrogenase (short-subunit alcohol dehydrogenase family)